MKITTTAESFLAAMKDMKPERETTIPVLSYVRLCENTLATTDLDMHTISTFDCKGTGEFLFPYKAVMNVLTGETGTLEIEFTPAKKSENPKEVVEVSTVKFTINGCEFKFNTLNIENFPQLPVPARTTLTISGKDFRALLDKVRFAISNEASRYALNCALLTTARDVFRMIGTDGHRMSVAELPMEGVPEFKAQVPVLYRELALSCNAYADVEGLPMVLRS